MTPFATRAFSFLFAAIVCATAPAQTPSPSPAEDKSEAMQLEELIKKIDEHNAKIDTLSQQILKLEQQVSTIRPGVMIGEATPSATAGTSSLEAAKPSQSSDSHVVAKGETLTSIAKIHKVSVEELQKFNHIENDRKLQIGQTIMIPSGAIAPTPTASPTPALPNQ